MSPAKAAGPLLQRHSLNILRCKSPQAPVVNMNYLYQAFNNTLVDWFKPPSMDWTFPGDLHNCFKLFKQKCELIFVGSLDKVQEANKARLLLLWIDDESLEIYNTSTWTNERGGAHDRSSYGSARGLYKAQGVIKSSPGTNFDA